MEEARIIQHSGSDLCFPFAAKYPWSIGTCTSCCTKFFIIIASGLLFSRNCDSPVISCNCGRFLDNNKESSRSPINIHTDCPVNDLVLALPHFVVSSVSHQVTLAIL